MRSIARAGLSFTALGKELQGSLIQGLLFHSSFSLVDLNATANEGDCRTL